ncbi:MAG: hypothetical protein FJ368_05900 [Pelagibacterales bacterium]|nr:hypothetical protein [Pelagibacterales bacterium]
MSNILDTINSLIIKSNGGLLFFWAAITALIIKAVTKTLMVLGGFVASGAIEAAIKSIMPMVKNMFAQEFDSLRQELREVKNDVSELKALKSVLDTYKKRAHTLEGENKNLKEVIKNKDYNIIEEISKMLKQNEKKQR